MIAAKMMDHRHVCTYFLGIDVDVFKYSYFLAFDILSVVRGHSFFLSSPQRPMISDFEGFSIPDFIHYILMLECSVLNKGTTGTIVL